MKLGARNCNSNYGSMAANRKSNSEVGIPSGLKLEVMKPKIRKLYVLNSEEQPRPVMEFQVWSSRREARSLMLEFRKV
jgi:hypothetical protein